MKTQQHNFEGYWITSEEFHDMRPINVFHRQLEQIDIKLLAPQNRHILLRKKFEVESSGKAFIYISADDYYKLFINGRFVCQGPAAGYHFHYYKLLLDSYISAFYDKEKKLFKDNIKSDHISIINESIAILKKQKIHLTNAL